ncbi:MAG: Fe-S protein assembly co-chaperone HscB [SAR324 cluster bacterium]|nr:Fe-S protein assembly co-chaperone HscB [SAR324 cluster bacterium]
MISPLFCFSCNSLQTVSDDIDHFKVMGLPHCFEIDSEELENLYQRLSLGMHPDFFGEAPEKQKLLSEKSSVMLNAAYSILREPSSRARYLLLLLAREKNLQTDALPEGFLQEMFIFQESLDEMLESGDQSALCKMNEELQNRHTFIESNYAALFKKFENLPENHEILQQLQSQLNAERYLRRLLDRINSE